MPITVNSLYRDSYNFMRNQISKFVMLALFASVIQYALTFALQTDLRAIDDTYKTNFTTLIDNPQSSTGDGLIEAVTKEMNQLSPEVQSDLVKDLMVIGFKQTLPSIFTELLLVAWTVALVLMITNGEQVNLVQAAMRSISKLPKMLIAGYLSIILMAIGFAVFVLPGVILFFGFTMVSVIIAMSNTSIIGSMIASLKIMFRYPGAIISATLFSIALSILSISVLSTLLAPFNSVSLILFLDYFIRGLIIIFFTLYFYRLFSFVQSNNR